MPTPTASEPLPPIQDRWRLFALVVIAVVVHAVVIGNTSLTARDSIGFARDAWNLKHPIGSRLDYIKSPEHPQHPGYALLIAATSYLVSPLYHGPSHDMMLRSAQITSSAAAVLLVFPMFWLGKMLFNSGTGFAAALLLTLLPVLARDTSDGLSDGPFLLFACSAVCFAVKAIRTSRRVASSFWLIFAGLFAGGAYLVRPEGLVVFVAVAATLVLGAFHRWSAVNVLVWLCAVLLGFLLLAGPYMVLIGKLTNKGAMQEKASAVHGVMAGPIFAETIPKDSTNIQRAWLTTLSCGRELLKTGHYAVAVFIVIGLLMLWPRWKREPQFWVPLFYMLGHTSILLLLGYRSGYISERHTIPTIAMGVLFAAGGLPVWAKWWAGVSWGGALFRWSYWPAATVLMLGITCIPNLMKPLHENRMGHKLAGQRLQEELARLTPTELEGAVVWDHYQWAQYQIGSWPGTRWAENMWKIPMDPPAANQRIHFILLETKDGKPEQPEHDSQRHIDAVRLLADPKYKWEVLDSWEDPTATKNDVKVVLYRSKS